MKPPPLRFTRLTRRLMERELTHLALVAHETGCPIARLKAAWIAALLKELG